MRGVPWMVVAVLSMGLDVGAQLVTPPPAPVRGEQTSQPDGPMGSVTGVVMAQDTQRPARFATVTLARVPTPDGAERMDRFGPGGGEVYVRTDIDGTFTASRVSVGDYYVTAMAQGYIPESALLLSQVAAGADPAALLAAMPVAHVTANGSTNITVTMQRGGVIGGHVEWEDGSPASGVPVAAVSTAGVQQLPSALRGVGNGNTRSRSSITDDRGNFRVTDLPSGDYVLMASMQSGTQQTGQWSVPGYTSPVIVYAPGVFRRGDAKAISVRAGDERTDARIVIDLRGLYAVSGHASSADPSLGVQTGGVNLVDSSDPTLHVQAQLDRDGGFKVRFVPPGTYMLRISDANSVAPNFGQFRRGGGDNGPAAKGVAFQEFTTTVTVSDTDVTGLALSLVPVTSQK